MAKKSAINRNERVRKLVKQFAAKRKALKDTAENETLSLEERFEARLKLAELPRNSAPLAWIANSSIQLALTRTSALPGVAGRQETDHQYRSVRRGIGMKSPP